MENNNENWKEIHEYFGNNYVGGGLYQQNLWKDHGFDYQITKEWAEVLGGDFEIGDFAFCAWVRDKKHLTLQALQQQGDAKELKQEYQKLWTDIDKDFAKESGVAYQ